ncbi:MULTISPECIES: hypothetical protein [Xanthomonas]|uniref:hypothetical protein n=1 Tax=Xanthomonas TaxID=338 RepID=UPI000E1F7C98|nr:MULTISPECIES: hypothetical protein [Xanthomonas]
MQVMPDLDDERLAAVETEAMARTMVLLKSLFTFDRFPKKDSMGIVRHGHGRPIERRAMTEEVAEFALSNDVQAAQACLRARIFELIVVHPEAVPRLPYIYALADILEPERMREWSPLWSAMRRGDWNAVGVELMTCHWDRYYGESTEKRRAVMQIIMDLARGPLL